MRVRISGSPDLPFVLTHPPSLLVELNCWSPEIDRGQARAMRGCSETSVALLSQKHLLCNVMCLLAIRPHVTASLWLLEGLRGDLMERKIDLQYESAGILQSV
jgi:hypothetical protein